MKEEPEPDCDDPASAEEEDEWGPASAGCCGLERSCT